MRIEPPFLLFDVERIGLSHEVAQLAKAVGSGIEVGSKIGKLLADFSEGHPAVLALHLVMTFLMMGVAALAGCSGFDAAAVS